MTSLSLTSHPLCLHLHPCCSPFAGLLSWLVQPSVLLSVCFSDCLFVPLSFHLPVWLLSPCWSVLLPVLLPVYLSVCLSVFLSVFLSIYRLSSVFLSICCLSFHLASVPLLACPSACPSACLFVCLSVCFSVCLSSALCFSVYLSGCPS